MTRVVQVLRHVAAATCAAAAEVRPGDQVRFIERDQHIPVHPAPGDPRVRLRFVSDLEATVLRVTPAIGWHHAPPPGRPPRRWGTLPRHVGLVSAHRLARAASEWPAAARHLESGESPCPGWPVDLYGGDPSVTRTATDYDRIRCYVRLFDPDILAVQEVDGEEALSRVADTEVYDVHVDDRPKGSLNGQQNTGFAVKRGLTVQRQPDFEALDIRGDGRLRYGARIDLTHNRQTLQLHVGASQERQFRQRHHQSVCATLLAQVPVLEGWIDTAAQGPMPFIVLGDFNRRFTRPDQVWAELDDGEPANADLTAVTQDMPISCRDHTLTEFIDHIVVDQRVVPWTDRTSFRQVTYRQADKDVGETLRPLSDGRRAVDSIMCVQWVRMSTIADQG